MKILVTGGVGFIGTNLIKELLKNHNKFNVVSLNAIKYYQEYFK